MEAEQIQQVRSFNRAVTQRIGVLDGDFMGRGRPLAESRLLFEIGRKGCRLRDVRQRLALDSGYLSRLLQSLERQKLITSQRAKHDSRVKWLAPTRKGLAELRVLDNRSDDLAASLLTPLSSSQRDALLEAMSRVEKLMKAAGVQIEPASVTDADARHCLSQYFKEIDERFQTGFDAEQDSSAMPDELTPPKGAFLVARLDGNPVGCGGLKCGDKEIGEIKRMWVAQSVRGLGVGRRILEALEQRAVESGLDTLRLETNRSLTEALSLYRSSGFKEVAPFNNIPHAHHWFEKRRLRSKRS